MVGERVVYSETEVVNAIVGALPDDLPPLLVQELASAAGPMLEEPHEPTSTPSFQLMVRRWVIRQSDLDILRTAVEALAATAAAGTLKADDVRSSLVGAAVAVLRAGRTLQQKGVTLEPKSVAVLAVIKKQDGLTTPELLGELDLPNLTPASLEDELERLRAVAIADHSVVALVSVDGDKRWHSLV